jgi:phospholipid-binding lipoprotein MlaA
MKNLLRPVLALGVGISLSGCASTTAQNPADPFEKFNRSMFTFNDKVDQYALKPTATVYKRVLPSFVQTGVYNFFSNLADVWTAANNLMQGRVEDGVSDVMRFAINSTFGLGGLIDVGSDAGLPKHRQDFGATLGVWGVHSGPYVVLPLLGPSTVRDTAALPLDWKGDLWRYVDPVNVRNIGIGVRVVDMRAGVLDASNLIEDAALDRYEFIRDAYLQRRASKISSSRERGPDSVYRPLPDEDLDVDMKTNNGPSLNAAPTTPPTEPADKRNLQPEKAPVAPAAPTTSGERPVSVPAPSENSAK